MPETIDGTIKDMRALDPNTLSAGQVFRVQGEDVEFGSGNIVNRDRIDTFVWDPEVYEGPLYDNAGTLEALQLVGFPPDLPGMRDGSSGLWKWVDPPRGFIDAGRIYGLRPTAAEDAKDPAKIIDNHAELPSGSRRQASGSATSESERSNISTASSISLRPALSAAAALPNSPPDSWSRCPLWKAMYP